MRRGPSRPPGPPPLRLGMQIGGVADLVVIEVDREAEPDVARRIETLAHGRAYDGARLRSKPLWLALELAADPPFGRTEPRRIVHSKFEPGSVGWSWERVPSDGRGEFFIARAREPGLDAAYQAIGRVVGGLEALLAIVVEPRAIYRGRKGPAPVFIESVRPL